MIAAALVLLVGAPAGAFAVGEESSGGSAPAGAAVEPSGDSAQSGAPASTEWSPQGGGGEASSGGVAPLQHGSSVGSGVVPGKAEPKSEAPSYTPDSGGSYEPEPSAPSPVTAEAPESTPRAESAPHSVQPEETETSSAVDVGVGAATLLGHSASPRGGEISSAPPAAAASLTGSGDRAPMSSYALPLLTIVIMLGLILGFMGVRLRRRRERRRLEALWREQDAVWEAALRRAELGQVGGGSEPSAEPLQRIKTA